MDGHDSDDDSHPELVVDSDEEDESSSTERPRTFASLSDTGHPEPAVARAPAESAADAQGPPERGPNEHLDVAARALVRAEGLSAGFAGDLARIFPPSAASSPARSPTKSEQDIGNFKMRLCLRIAADPEAFFALADTAQDDSLSPEEWLEACRSSLGNADETECRALFDGVQGGVHRYAQRHPPVSQGRQVPGDSHRGAVRSCRSALESRGR